MASCKSIGAKGAKGSKGPMNAGTKGGLEHETDKIAATAEVYSAHRGASYGTPDPKPTATPAPVNPFQPQGGNARLKEVMDWMK